MKNNKEEEARESHVAGIIQKGLSLARKVYEKAVVLALESYEKAEANEWEKYEKFIRSAYRKNMGKRQRAKYVRWKMFRK